MSVLIGISVLENLCDNLFTEQNCAQANRFVSVQVLVKKSMKLIT